MFHVFYAFARDFSGLRSNVKWSLQFTCMIWGIRSERLSLRSKGKIHIRKLLSGGNLNEFYGIQIRSILRGQGLFDKFGNAIFSTMSKLLAIVALDLPNIFLTTPLATTALVTIFLIILLVQGSLTLPLLLLVRRLTVFGLATNATLIFKFQMTTYLWKSFYSIIESIIIFIFSHDSDKERNTTKTCCSSVKLLSAVFKSLIIQDILRSCSTILMLGAIL